MTNTEATSDNLEQISIKNLDVPLEQSIFFRSLIRELSGLLEEMIGIEEASGYISVVGQRVGTEIDNQYRKKLQVDHLNKAQVGEVLVDLKKRIEGDFYVIELDEDKIVLGNRACPFGDKVINRPSLCMMTSNVFGTIAADNNDYAKVVLGKTIASGDSMCHVTVYFNETEESEQQEGQEYYRAEG